MEDESEVERIGEKSRSRDHDCFRALLRGGEKQEGKEKLNKWTHRAIPGFFIAPLRSKRLRNSEHPSKRARRTPIIAWRIGAKIILFEKKKPSSITYLKYQTIESNPFFPPPLLFSPSYIYFPQYHTIFSTPPPPCPSFHEPLLFHGPCGAYV